MSTGETTATAAGDKPFKLLQARDANGLTVSAHEIGLDPEPFTRPLRCAYCEHLVHTQRAHPKTSKNGKPFTVSAHFYLAKEKGGGQAEHDQGCDLRTTHTITTIARKSDGFAVIRGGKLQLRLVVPASTDPPALAAPLPGTPVLAPPLEPVNHRIRSVGPPMPPVITSAARIAQLLALYGHDPDHLARFTVKHPDLRTPVPWPDFCFGPAPASLARLYRKLERSASRYPVAVHGQVLDHGVRNGYGWCLIARDVPTDADATTQVFLRSPAPELLAPLTRGMHVLALGAHDSRWETWTPKPEGSRPHIRLFIKAHWQLSYWSVDAAGLPTEPQSPPPIAAPLRPTPRRRPTATVPPSAAAAAPTVPMVHDIPELHGIDIPPMPTYKPDTPTPKDGSP